ncbi:MAG: glycosyltransferase family 2 protein [Metamycoplasmataceae bacterium]
MISFSIIIPVHNGSKYLSKTIDKIIDSSYDKSLIQLIIVDDGSKDDSLKIAKEYKKQYSFIEVYSQKNGNWGSVINFVKDNNLVKNDYVGIIDVDNFYNEDVFYLCDEILKINKWDVIAGYANIIKKNKIKGKIKPYLFLNKKKIKNKYQMKTKSSYTISFFVKKEIFNKTKKLLENIPCQNIDLINQYFNYSNNVFYTKKSFGVVHINNKKKKIIIDDKTGHNLYITYWNLIENDSLETIYLKLFHKKYREYLKKNNLKLVIKRKIKLSWYPFYLRIFLIIWSKYFLKLDQYFILEK